jgi:hypothetical protein
MISYKISLSPNANAKSIKVYTCKESIEDDHFALSTSISNFKTLFGIIPQAGKPPAPM